VGGGHAYDLDVQLAVFFRRQGLGKGKEAADGALLHVGGLDGRKNILDRRVLEGVVHVVRIAAYELIWRSRGAVIAVVWPRGLTAARIFGGGKGGGGDEHRVREKQKEKAKELRWGVRPMLCFLRRT
jgi:hypothetical protein